MKLGELQNVIERKKIDMKQLWADFFPEAVQNLRIVAVMLMRIEMK